VYEDEAPLPDKRLLTPASRCSASNNAGHPGCRRSARRDWWAVKDSKPWARWLRVAPNRVLRIPKQT